MKHLLNKYLVVFVFIGIFLGSVLECKAAIKNSGNGIRNNGVYEGITINIYGDPYTSIISGDGDPYGSGGCTWFVSGRVYELTGKKCAINGPNTWYNTQGPANGFTSTQTLPRTHKSIICTKGDDVHVGIVEYVYSNGAVIISEGGCHLAPDNDYCNIGLYSSISDYMSVMKLTKFIGYVDLGVSFSCYSDTEPPVISSVQVTNLDKNGYTVTCNVSDNIGVVRVAFPTWTDADWQDDIVWQDGTVTNGTATFRVNISDHGNQRGKYLTYIYAYDAAGNVSAETDSVHLYVYVEDVAPVVSNARVIDITDDGYTVTCDVSDNIGVTRVAFPTWTDTDWQDDIVWQDGTVTNGTAAFRVNISDHGNQRGKYLTYIYAYDACGNVSEETDAVRLYVYLAPVIHNTLPVNLGEEFYAYIRHQSANVYLTNQQNNIGGETFTGENRQIWRFDRQSNGAYSISSDFDNACMEVAGASTEDGANVYANSGGYLGNANQEFFIYRAYDAYYLSPVHTNGAFALDMNSITHNLEMWGVGADWAPQEFDLEEVLYKLEYDPNGGIDAPENQTKYYGEDLTLSTDVPQWESRIFLGWATLPDAAEAEYQPGDIYSEDKDVTLYAQWSPIKVTGIGIPGTQILSIGESKTLTAVITPDDALNKDVAWKSSDTSVVTVTNGTIKGVKEGTATVTATASDGSGVSAGCTVTVRPTITGLTLNRSSLQLADEGLGSSYLLKVEKIPGSGQGTVNWSSSSTAVAQVAQNGVVTAQGTGTATITASVVNGPSISCTVSVVGNMSIMTLPAGLKTIEEEAFLNTAAARIVIPSGVESIGTGAFADSSALKYVAVPDSVVSIADGVFADDPNLCLICSENSAAEEYAVANGIEYTTEGASGN